MRLRIPSIGFDYIVRDQTTFEELFERTGTETYKIRDGITSVYVKAGKGNGSASANRFLSAGNYIGYNILSGGDLYGQISTNDCLFFYCEGGTEIDWSNKTVGWIINDRRFVGENCHNFGDAQIPNIEKNPSSTSPVLNYVGPTGPATIGITSKISSGGSGGGLLKNWMFSGMSLYTGFEGENLSSSTYTPRDYTLVLEDCVLRGCSADYIGSFYGFVDAKLKNCKSVGNQIKNYTIGIDNFIYYRCGNSSGLHSINDFYDVTLSGAFGSPGSYIIMKDCMNINNIHINYALSSASFTISSGSLSTYCIESCNNLSNVNIQYFASTIVDATNPMTTTVVKSCSRIENININNAYYNAPVTSSTVLRCFDTCTFVSNFDIYGFVYTGSASSSATYTIINNCSYFNNGRISSPYYSRNGFTGSFYGMDSCNYFSNISISNIAATVTSAVSEILAVRFTNYLTNVLLDVIGGASIGGTPIVRGFATCKHLTGCRVTNMCSSGSVLSTSAAFYICAFIAGAYSDSTSGASGGKDYRGCDYISSAQALGGSGGLYWINCTYMNSPTAYSTNSA